LSVADVADKLKAAAGRQIDGFQIGDDLHARDVEGEGRAGDDALSGEARTPRCCS
jgi:hypothetical protein